MARYSFFKRVQKRVCFFCTEKTIANYKDVELLKKFVSEQGKILPRRVTGNCAKHQRTLAIAIKRAREIGLLPYVAK